MYRKSQEEYQESLRETISTADENIQKYTDEKNSLLSLQSRLEDAKNDKAKLLSIQGELNKAIGETPGLVKNEGNAYDKASAKIQARIKELDELAKKEAQNKIDAQKEIFRTNTTPYELGTDNLANVGLDIDIQDAVEELNRLKAERQELIDIGAKEDSIGITDYDKKIARYTQILQGKVEEAKEIFADYIDTEFNDDISKSYANKYIETLIFGGEDDLDNIQGKIDEIKPKIEQFNDLKNKLLDLQVDGKNTDEIALEIQGLIDKIKKASPEVAELMQTSLNSLVPSDETVNAGIEKIKEAFKKAFGKEEQSTFNNWINNLSDEDKEIVYKISCETDTAKFNLEDWQNALANYNSISNLTAEDIQAKWESSAEKTNKIISNISSAQEALSSQKTGVSISIDDFNSDELADYRSALEYVNGTMQLNADKVNEIVKAKSDEQIALNNTNKALAQSKYLNNAKQIEQYREQLRSSNKLSQEQKKTIKNSIDALLEENSTLADTCSQYDLLSASLRETTGAYQHWLNAQNSSDYGDMADDAVSAIQRIRDTYDSNSDIFGNFGSKKFDAAVEFIIPDSVDSDDISAIESYMADFKKYLSFDDNGKAEGLNIDKFLSDSVEAGLMSYSEDDGFKILGGKKMKDFAEGLNLSSGVVQAFFDELQLKGGEFDWGDEAVKTIGDLAVEANEAAESLRKIDGNSNLKIKMDVSDLTTPEEQVAALEATIKEMDGVKAKLGVDSSEIDNANAVIQYCLIQKQLLTQPDVMRVDTSKVEGDIGNAISLLQEFQNAQNDLEIKQKVGADTTEAQAKIDSLTSEIQNLSPDIKVKLDNLDTTSVEAIKTSISSLTAETINVKANVDASAIAGYTPETKQCDVIYNPKTDLLPQSFDSMDRMVVYKPDTSGLPQNFSTITRYVNYVKTGEVEVNGTAHLSGTAKAGGDWGTAPGGRTLVGELGRKYFATIYRNIYVKFYLIAGKP